MAKKTGVAKKSADSSASVAIGTTFRFDPAKTPPAAPLLLVPLVSKPAAPAEVVARADRLCGKAVSEIVNLKALGDEAGKIVQTTRGKGDFPRVAVVGLGERAKVDGN